MVPYFIFIPPTLKKEGKKETFNRSLFYFVDVKEI